MSGQHLFTGASGFGAPIPVVIEAQTLGELLAAIVRVPGSSLDARDAILAAIAGSTSVALLAATADIRYRILGGFAGCSRASGTVIDVAVQGVVGGVTRRFINSSAASGAGGNTTTSFTIPEPGILCDENTAVSLTVASTAATGNAVGGVWFVAEAA